MKNQACRFVGVGVCVVTIGTAREKDDVPQKRQTGSERLFVCGRQQFDMNEEKRSVCIVLSLEDACQNHPLLAVRCVTVECVLLLTRKKQREKVEWVWEP